jgi:hypothetical protein
MTESYIYQDMATKLLGLHFMDILMILDVAKKFPPSIMCSTVARNVTMNGIFHGHSIAMMIAHIVVALILIPIDTRS